MAEGTTTIEQPTTPTPAVPEPRGRTLSEQKFFAQKDASSLPIPSEPPTQTTPVETTAVPAVAEPIQENAPAPVTPPAPVADPQVTPPVPASADEPATPPVEPTSEIPEDDFSVELPGMQKEDGVLLDGPAVKHPDSPLGDDAPSWQHDAFNRLQADTNISEADKKTIAELPPTAWDKARRWQADTKLLGQFRDTNVPIATVFDILSKQSKERMAEFETEAITALLSEPEKMVNFSAKHPEIYAQVMAELVNNHSDFVAAALKKRGFNVVAAEPFDVNTILNKIKEHPLYESFAETDIADLVNEEIERLGAMVGTGKEVTPEELAAQIGHDQPDGDANAVRERLALVQNEIKTAQDTHWLKAIGDGLQASGIKPATQEELAKNPAGAHLKTVLFNAALYGLPGVITDWDSHSESWGAGQPGFAETFGELASYLQSGDIPRFKENAPALNSFYYQFGQKRAGIALIKNLYAAVDKMMAGSPADPPPAPPVPQVPSNTNGNVTPQAEPKGRTFSERRFFANRGQ